MTDFDFDEIDRAVSSVNTDVPTGNNNAEEPSVQSAVNQPAKLESPTPALAGRRSSGQFMDVVHPSSNMRRPSLVMPERPAVSNVNTNDSSVPPTNLNPLNPPNTNQQLSKTELPTPTIPNSGWSNTKNEGEDADIDKISKDISNELGQKLDNSPDTPFISGTKVEKRPLGAFSTESTPKIDKQDDQNKPSDNTDKSLPDELQDKLLSIESDEISAPEDQKESVATDEKPEIAEKTEIPATNTKSAIATSITQQYKEKPSTGDRDSGPIYDTNSYHKPLVPLAKKKSNWMWVIWILIIIIAGIGAGVITFEFILPNL